MEKTNVHKKSSKIIVLKGGFMTLPYDKYTSDEYLKLNPSWDIEDAPWKAVMVSDILKSSGVTPDSICEVGCGAGGVLASLRRAYPRSELYGYDIAPAASQFWHRHAVEHINFQLGDFFTLNRKKYDVILLLDVIEHLMDPFTFLHNLSGLARYYIFHIPLDLSALSVLRESPILKIRQKVGHINYFTKNLALKLLQECEFEVLQWKYSNAAFNSPQRTWKTVLASIPRFIAYFLNKDWGVRALGGETLFVLSQDGKDTP